MRWSRRSAGSGGKPRSTSEIGFIGGAPPRSTRIDACCCNRSPEPAEHLAIDATGRRDVLRLIVQRLEQFGIESFGLDLTRAALAVPAARVIAPGLQLEPSEIVTPRLADMIAQTGGGAIYTGGIALI